MTSLPFDPLGIISQLRQQVATAQQEIARSRVEGSAGGGAVRVVMTGNQKVLEVHIDPALLHEGDVELLQDMLVGAFNQAVDAARKLAEEKMGHLSDFLGQLGISL